MANKVSDVGIRKIILREGERLNAYKDSVGVWTIGVGHTGRMSGELVRPGMTITKQQSYEFLKADLAPVEAALNRALKVETTQNQFDALASFLFNVGTGWTKASIFTRLNAGDILGAAAAFDMFHKPPEIIGRRNSEKEQFLTPDTATQVREPSTQVEQPKMAQEKKGTSMFGGLIIQQWQSILRWGLNAAGTAAVAGGYLSSGQVSKGTDIAMTVIGGLVSLGSMAWSIHSNQASVIKSTANKL